MATIGHAISEAPSVWVHWGTSTTSLQSTDHIGAKLVVELPLGVESLVLACFHQSQPGPVELERAIDLVEDALDGVSVQPGLRTLATCDPALFALAQLEGYPLGIGSWGMTRDHVENIFQHMASASFRIPDPSRELLSVKEDWARLLILRELMHHLSFEDVLFVPSNAAL
jgi:hypothetical protein